MTVRRMSSASSASAEAGTAADGVSARAADPNQKPVATRASERSASATARHNLIAQEAYHRAEQRGFAPGDDWQDWFAAEHEIDELLDPDL